MHMSMRPFHAVDQRLLKEGRESRRVSCALHAALQLRAGPKEPSEPLPQDPGDGSGHRGSRLDVRGDRSAAGLGLAPMKRLLLIGTLLLTACGQLQLPKPECDPKDSAGAV